MNEDNALGGAVRFIDTSITNFDDARATASGTASLLVRNESSTPARPIEFDNVDISDITFDTGAGAGQGQNVFLDTNNGVLSFNNVTINNVNINTRETTLDTLLCRIEAAPTLMSNIAVSNLTMTANNNTGGSIKGLALYDDISAAMTVNTASFTNITMDGIDGSAEIGAWGFTATDGADVIVNGATSTNCIKDNFFNAVGGVATANGVEAGNTSNRSSITLDDCHTSNCTGAYGAGGYGTAGGDITVTNSTVTDCESGTHAGSFGVPNGVAWYKGGTGDMLIEDSVATRCNSTNTNYGQAIFSHNNSDTGPDRVCSTTLRRVTVQGTASTALISAVHLRNVSGNGFAHNVLIEDGVYNNDGINEVELEVNNGEVLNVTISGAQIKGYTGPANQVATAYNATDLSFGSLQIVVGGLGGTVNLTLTDVTDILGAPTLTGASTFNITNMPNWMTQVGDTGVVNYADTSWGGQYSENSIGGGIGGGKWFMEVQAIDTTGLLTASTGIWVYIRP
jgi:hypothetical protein